MSWVCENCSPNARFTSESAWRFHLKIKHGIG